MKAIIGLGNPGKNYEFTRHNAGFLMVDYYAMEAGFSIKRLRHKALLAETVVAGEKVLFVKPQTFMNRSGEAVRTLLDYYPLSPQDLLVIYDDISLPLGKIRIREQGTHGGHNGIKNIMDQLHTQEIPRVKIGVSEKEGQDLADYVLSPFSKKELTQLREIAKINCKVIDTFLSEGAVSAMNRFNSIHLKEEDS